MEIATAVDDVTEGCHVDETAIADVDGFARAYAQYRLPVYRYLRARGELEEDALDLTATTFERAFAKRHGFRQRDGGLGAWLFRIARNAAIDAHRRRKAEAFLTSSDDVHLAMDADHAERERQEVVEAVSTLPEVQREAIWLRYASGLTAREIGSVLGRSEAAIQKQIQRALDTLREAFT